MKNGCKEFISKAMDSINDIHYFDNRLHNITFTQTTLRIALKRGYCVEETMQLLDDLRNYIVYRDFEKPLLEEGWQVIVFVPSEEEDSDRITCGNALISLRRSEETRND